MGGRIVLTQVGFDFHDPRAQELSVLAPYQDFA
jgi:hypothetical protein